jgi:hypothetical protein
LGFGWGLGCGVVVVHNDGILAEIVLLSEGRVGKQGQGRERQKSGSGVTDHRGWFSLLLLWLTWKMKQTWKRPGVMN